jgi:hypothetical protein
MNKWFDSGEVKSQTEDVITREWNLSVLQIKLF